CSLRRGKPHSALQPRWVRITNAIPYGLPGRRDRGRRLHGGRGPGNPCRSRMIHRGACRDLLQKTSSESISGSSGVGWRLSMRWIADRVAVTVNDDAIRAAGDHYGPHDLLPGEDSTPRVLMVVLAFGADDVGHRQAGFDRRRWDGSHNS